MAILERARDAVTAHDLPQALTLLLQFWKTNPAVAIAEAIDAVGARAAANLTSPTGKTAKERNQAWAALATAGDPVMRGVLLSCLTETKGSGETLERIELLVPFLPDPRLSARIGDLIEVPIYNATVSRTAPFWRRLYELLPSLGDPRVKDRAAAWPVIWAANEELNAPEPVELQRRLGKIADQIAALQHKELDQNETAILAALMTALGGQRINSNSDEKELLEAVWADPVSDAPRLVYADWLQERGDPRGEFIALQMRKRTRVEAKREKELQAEFGERWLGPLQGKVLKTDLAYERGFVSEATCASAIEDTRAWSTLHEIRRGVPPSDQYRMPLLKTLTNIDDAAIHTLASLKIPLNVESLDWEGPHEFQKGKFDKKGAAVIKAFGNIAVLPKLQRLSLNGSWSWHGREWQETDPTITPSHLQWAWTSPATENLKELLFPAHITMLPDFIKALTPTKIESFTVRSKAEAWSRKGIQTIVTRDNQGAFNQAEILVPVTDRHRIGYYAEGLSKLPPNLLPGLTVTIHAESWSAVTDQKPLIAAVEKQNGTIKPTGRIMVP